MPKSLIFVYIVTATLFAFQQTSAPNYLAWHKPPSCPWLSKKKVTKNGQIEKLKQSFLCGKKKRLKKATKKAYKNLNLYHLFTPSGIHLGIFYFLNAPLIKFFKNKSYIIFLIYKILLAIWPWFLPGYFSLKRIGGIHLLKLLPFNISGKFLFFIFFTFDFFFGTYSMSPQSWTYSFIFLGIVFHTYKKSYLNFSLYLFSGQLLAAIFTYQNVYILSFLPSFILTAAFTPVFIFAFFDNLLNFIGIDVLEPISNQFIYIFNEAVLITNQLITKTSKLKPEIFSLIITLGILIKNKRIVTLALIFHSSRIYNLPDARVRQSSYAYQNDFYFKEKIVDTKFDRRGIIRLEFDNKRKCSIKLLNYGKTKRCNFKKN